MTAVIERPHEVAVAAPVTVRVGSRPSVRALLGLVVLAVLLGAGLGAYTARVVARYPVASYGFDPTGTAWLQATPATATAAFRAAPTLPGAPVSATLWVDARDTYRVWVNGRAVTNNQAAAYVGSRPLAASVDVRSLLKAGTNVIAAQVRALGNDTAAFWTRLDLRYANGSTASIGTGSSLWMATSNVTQTGAVLGDQPGYVNSGFSTDGWAHPLTMPPARPITVSVPSEVLSAPATPASLGAVTSVGGTVTYHLRIDVPRSRDAWLRLSATGAAVVTVNGSHITDRPAPGYVSLNSHRPAPLWLIHIGNRLHTGSNEITVSVGAETTSSAVIDTIVDTGSGWTKIPVSAQTWSVDTAGRYGVPLVLGVSTATSAFPNGFTAVLVPETGRATPWTGLGIGAAIGLAIPVVVLFASRRPSRRIAGATGTSVTVEHRLQLGAARLGRLLLALLPAAAVICVALVIGRWVTVGPGLAYRPTVVILAAVALLIGPLVAGIVRLLRRTGASTEPIRAAKTSAAQWFHRLPWLTPARGAVIAIAALSTFAQGWRLGRQPLWQDEVTSLQVARAIQSHGLPRLESGLFYFKGELYHGLIAVLLTVTDSTTVIRAVSVLWFAGTVLVFGLLLMPLVTERAWITIAATALLVLVPAELAWARDVRMYQQMQFFAVLFLALFLRALRDGRRRDIVLSAVTMLAMYLSHEESFVMLPAVPVVLLLARHSVWPHRRVYLAAYTPAFFVVAVQYLVSHIHPVDFGDDLSNRPYVGWDPQQADFYYQKVFFAPLQSASLAVLSTLAVIGAVAAVRRRDRAPMLLGVVLGVTVLTTSLLFTAKVDRYSFIVLPVLVALAVLGGVRLAGWLARCCRSVRRAADGRLARTPTWVRVGCGLTAAVAALAVVATLAVSPRGYGLWAADVSGTNNPLTHNDYQATVRALRKQIQPGDGVITLSPPVMTELYLGRRPDRVIQTGRNKLLYLVLRDGQAVDTLLGVRVVLTAADLRTYLEAHQRVWLVSDTGSYLQGVPPDVQDEIRADFHIVIQNATTTVSAWDIG